MHSYCLVLEVQDSVQRFRTSITASENPRTSLIPCLGIMAGVYVKGTRIVIIVVLHDTHGVIALESRSCIK